MDKTSLKGLFDFIMHMPDEVEPTGPPDPVPPILAAIEELGLKLEAAKGPVEVLVIDSVLAHMKGGRKNSARITG